MEMHPSCQPLDELWGRVDRIASTVELRVPGGMGVSAAVGPQNVAMGSGMPLPLLLVLFLALGVGDSVV